MSVEDQTIHKEISDIKSHLSKQDIHSAERAKDIEYIKGSLQKIECAITELMAKKETEHTKFNDRIGRIETQMGKLTIYWTVALSLSGFFAQFLMKYLDKFIK